MRKLFLGLPIILLLLLFVFPFSALAAVSIDPIPDKVPGESVMLTGTTDLSEVSIKVICPNDTVLYVDVINTINGVYSKDFTLPLDAELGMYTVVVGQGQDVVTGTIAVSGSGSQSSPTNSSSSGNNNSSSGGSAATVTAGQTVAGSGGRITQDGLIIDIPAGAVGKQVRVVLKKITNLSDLPLSKGRIVSDVFDINKNLTGDFDKLITVTLPFNKSEVDTDKYDLIICWLNEKTNEWIKLENITVDLLAGKVSGKINHFTKFAVIADEKAASNTADTVSDMVVLKDIAGHWAESTIRQMADRGVTKGYPDKSFQPDKNITRAEFAVFLVKAFNLEQKDGGIFKDTIDHWAKDDIITVAIDGIIGGYDAERFGPNDLITREQMAAMIVRAKKLTVAEEILSFADTPDISAWAKAAVATATKNGLLSGYPDNTVKPRGNATRAEAVTVIYNALK